MARLALQLHHRISIPNWERTANMKIHRSQLTPLPSIGVVKKVPHNSEVKFNSTNKLWDNPVLSGKDQLNFQDFQIHLFGVKTEFLQKLLCKVSLEIAGSFPLHQQLLLFLPESKKCLSILNIPQTELLRSNSTSEVKKLVLPLMIDFQSWIIHLDTPQYIQHLTRTRPQVVLGG